MTENSLEAIRRFENRLSVAYSRYKKGKIWRVRCICGEWMDIWGDPEEMVIAVCTDPHHVMSWNGYRERFCKILTPLR